MSFGVEVRGAGGGGVDPGDIVNVCVEIGNQTVGDANNNLVYGDATALGSLADGTKNSVFGVSAGAGITGGDYNTLMGFNAGAGVTTGDGNTIIGHGAAPLITVDIGTTAIGNEVLKSATVASYSTGLGCSALEYNTTGIANTALGYTALNYNRTGQCNTVIGCQAGVGVSGNSHSNNTFVGYQSGFAITTGSSNICVGSGSGAALTTGGSVTFIGKDAGKVTTTGANSIAIGYGAAAACNLSNGAIAIGSSAMGSATGSPQRCIGIGYAALLLNQNASSIGIGWYALADLVSADGNMGIGYEAGRYVTGANNTHVGYITGHFNVSGTGNTYLGSNAGYGASGKSHSNNTFVGFKSGYSITTGGTSTVIGSGAGYTMTTNGGQVFLGYYSGRYETAANKLFIDNQDRTNEATSRTNSMIYGEFNATPSSQQVTFNSDLQCRYKPVWIPSATQTLANDAAISPNAGIVRVAGDGGAAVLDTDPAISDGSYDGQLLIVEGTSDTNTVEIENACNTKLVGGTSVTLGLGDAIHLHWSNALSLWVEPRS